MIDLHAHYLPALDDGPKTLADSIKMAQLAVQDGIHSVTVTPHHLNGRYLTEAATVREAVQSLQQTLSEHAIPLTLYPGSEIHLVPELPEGLRNGTVMTVADRGRAVLVELPVNSLPLGAEVILSECLALGITPVIAHPERCRPLQTDLTPLQRWVDMGCLVQITAQSCTGRFGSGPQASAHAMITNRLVHVLASDGHRPYGRTPCLREGREAVTVWAGEDYATQLTESVPQALLDGNAPDIKELMASMLHSGGINRPSGRQRGGWKRWFGVRD